MARLPAAAAAGLAGVACAFGGVLLLASRDEMAIRGASAIVSLAEAIRNSILAAAIGLDVAAFLAALAVLVAIVAARPASRRLPPPASYSLALSGLSLLPVVLLWVGHSRYLEMVLDPATTMEQLTAAAGPWLGAAVAIGFGAPLVALALAALARRPPRDGGSSGAVIAALGLAALLAAAALAFHFRLFGLARLAQGY